MIELPARAASAAVAFPIPRAKVSPPQAAGYPRQRLLTALRDAEHRLVLVTAPPGAGKTTLLADFARSTAERSVAWCRIEDQDASPAGLVRVLGTAVTLALEGSGREVGSDDALLALLDRPGPRLVIVVDDAHLLDGTPAEATMARMIRLLPAQVQLVLAARAEPGFVSCGPRLCGMVADITADDLRFRSWEVEGLFRDWYQAALSPEDAAALTRHTEGWAAGLRLFHLATGGKPADERRRAVASLWGMSRLLRRYLASTVLAALPDDVADFLVRSCALGVLEPTLCDRLLERSGSHLVLRELAEAQLFTLRCDDDGDCYRYHAVLQSQLESMLAERLGTEGTRDWYRRAARLLDEAGLWAAAYRAYARAEDWASGAQVLLRYSAQGIADAAPPIPRLLDDDPWLSLADARRHATAGRIAAAIEAFGRSEDGFDDPVMRRRCRDERRLLAPWAPGGPPLTGTSWSEALRAAVRTAPDRLRGGAGRDDDPGWQLATGLAALLDGRPQQALPALAAAGTSSGGFVPLAARIATAVVDIGSDAGPDESTDASDHDAEALALDAELAGHPWLARLARALAATDDPVELAGLVQRCDADGDDWGALLITVLAAVAAVRRGDQAPPQLATAADRAERLGARAVLSWARSTRTAVLSAAPARRPVRVALRCFGRFSLTVDGREVDLAALRPRARAALRLLALHAGRPVHEEVLLDALWPRTARSAGKRNLQVTISSVRTALEPGRPKGAPSMLQRRGEAYLLELPDDADTDVGRFGRAVAAWRAASSAADVGAALRDVLAAYDGELLPEDGPAEWVVPERDRLRSVALEAATALAERALVDADGPGAVQACHVALRIDGFHDAAWRLLIRACEQAGDVGAAVRARRRYQAALAELGCAP